MTEQLTPYITPLAAEEEWRVLLTLAQAPLPSLVCRTLNWQRELFEHAETARTFLTVSKAQEPIMLSVPPEYDGLAPLDEEELRAMRQRMSCVTLNHAALSRLSGESA